MNAIDMNLIHVWDDADAKNRHQTVLHDLLDAYRAGVITRDQLLSVDAVLETVYGKPEDLVEVTELVSIVPTATGTKFIQGIRQLQDDFKRVFTDANSSA